MPMSTQSTIEMYTYDQVRRMLPKGASDRSTAVRARCVKAGAYYVPGGYDAGQVDQVRAGRMTVDPIDLTRSEPFTVYTWAQVREMMVALGWHPTDSAIRFHLRGRGVISHPGYAPPVAVLAACERPAGSGWRTGITGSLKGRSFDASAPTTTDDDDV